MAEFRFAASWGRFYKDKNLTMTYNVVVASHLNTVQEFSVRISIFPCHCTLRNIINKLHLMSHVLVFVPMTIMETWLLVRHGKNMANF